MSYSSRQECVKKLLEFATDELLTADTYVDMMKLAQDSTMYNKFKEIANQELCHYEYDFQTALSLIAKMKTDGEIESANDFISCVLMENNLDWKNKILWKMQNTKMMTK